MAGTAAVIGIVATVVGTGATIYQAQEAADDRREEKKRLKEQRLREMELQSEETEKLIGRQRALFAASGVDVSQGSPLAVIEETQQDADEQRMEMLNAYGYSADALDSDISRIETTGAANAAGTLLSGIGSYASSPSATNPFA